jgi:formate--tetrahydrofolate ligase
MKVGLHTADIGVVEAGFGFDLGGEKFFDLVMRGGPMSPAAVVIIVSLRALRLHGGVAADQVATPNQAAVVAGLPNMIRHIENASLFKRPVIIALNAFAHDSVAEVTEVRAAAERAGASFAVIDATMRGAEGGVALAQVVTAALAGPDPGPAPTLYAPDAPLREKIERVATSIYRATSVVLSDEATAQLADLEARGYGKLPVCMAKTPASFSDDPSRINTPEGHTLTVRRFELAAGAGFVIALCGTIMRMPGLPREPRALAIDLVGNTIVGVE